MGRNGRRRRDDALDSMIAAGAHVALSGYASALHKAADALDDAAQALKDKAALGFEANQAYEAALRAREAAGVEGETTER